MSAIWEVGTHRLKKEKRKRLNFVSGPTWQFYKQYYERVQNVWFTDINLAFI